MDPLTSSKQVESICVPGESQNASVISELPVQQSSPASTSPAGLSSSSSNFQPMIKVVTAISGSVTHALSVILGDKERYPRDVTPNVLSA